MVYKRLYNGNVAIRSLCATDLHIPATAATAVAAQLCRGPLRPNRLWDIAHVLKQHAEAVVAAATTAAATPSAAAATGAAATAAAGTSAVAAREDGAEEAAGGSLPAAEPANASAANANGADAQPGKSTRS